MEKISLNILSTLKENTLIAVNKDYLFQRNYQLNKKRYSDLSSSDKRSILSYHYAEATINKRNFAIMKVDEFIKCFSPIINYDFKIDIVNSLEPGINNHKLEYQQDILLDSILALNDEIYASELLKSINSLEESKLKSEFLSLLKNKLSSINKEKKYALTKSSH